MNRLAIIIPIWKRPELTAQVLQHYARLTVTGCNTIIIAVGSEGGDSLRLAQSCNAQYVEAPNEPLHGKFDCGFGYARLYNPDAVALVGSDDVITAEYFSHAVRLIDGGVESVGLLDCFLVDSINQRVAYWVGYDHERKGEPIAAGRVISASLLQELDWMPYDSTKPLPNVPQQIRDDERLTERISGASAKEVTLRMSDAGCWYWNVKSGNELNRFSAFDIYETVDVTLQAWPLFEQSLRQTA